MAELQPTDDTMDLSKVGTPINSSPTTVQDASRNGGGFGNWNIPTGNPGNPVPPASDNVGMRGYIDDHDADDKGVNV